MKCVNCGANFSARDLYCPYCGTENLRGRRWQRQRAEAARDYHEARSEELPLLRRRLANKVLNRALLIEGVLFALLIVGVFLAFFLGDAADRLQTTLHRDRVETELAQLYEEGRYGELHLRLDETGLFGQEHYEYSQMALLHYDYEDFVLARMEFLTQREAPEEYTMERLIGSMHEVLSPYIPAYPELTERNARQLEEYQREVTAFAAAMLGMEEAELARLRQDYLTMDEEAALISAVLERGCYLAEN